MIQKMDIINLVQKSKVLGDEKTVELYGKAKSIIINAIQQQYNIYEGQGYVARIPMPEDFIEKVSKSNLPKEHKDLIIGGR